MRKYSKIVIFEEIGEIDYCYTLSHRTHAPMFVQIYDEEKQ